MNCITCKRPFVPAVPSQGECVSCMIAPTRTKKFFKLPEDENDIDYLVDKTFHPIKKENFVPKNLIPEPTPPSTQIPVAPHRGRKKGTKNKIKEITPSSNTITAMAANMLQMCGCSQITIVHHGILIEINTRPSS